MTEESRPSLRIENSFRDAPDEAEETLPKQDLLLRGINKGQKITFVTHTLSRKLEKQLDFTICAILKRYSKGNLQSALYTCVKEMVVNATKANAKKTFFDERKLNILDPEDYALGMGLLKDQLSEFWIARYGKKAKQQNLDVTIAFIHSEDGIRIEVINDAGITPFDERRMRAKLSQGMAHDNLLDYYAANTDKAEGEGMGLVMSIVMLKGENLNPALFRIGNKDGKAVARLEIPFTDKFVSVRGHRPAANPEPKPDSNS